jgi:hypothetical protein
MKTTIPFQGFYNSIHDGELDNSLEMAFSDDSGHVNDRLHERAFDAVQWSVVHASYASAYAEAFAELAGLQTLKFVELDSPREYNFTTDRIFCDIDISDVRAALARLPAGALDEKARERFTSRSGFMSYYSPDVESWGALESWDLNQIGTILECLADTLAHTDDQWDQWDEYSLCEDFSGSGYIDNWLFSAPAMGRLDKVNYYLRQRAER